MEIDAADALEKGDPTTLTQGITPALAALEMLLYPKSATVIENTIRAQAGDIEIIPPEAPLTLFVWGPQRVLPVRLTGFSITEEAFDPALNPLRAKVELSLQVLSHADFKATAPGHHLFLAHQIAKEVAASISVTTSIENLGASLKIL